MRGAIPPLHQYAVMAWCPVKSTETALLLPLQSMRRFSEWSLPFRFSDQIMFALLYPIIIITSFNIMLSERNAYFGTIG
jgi:hypothetical protein